MKAAELLYTECENRGFLAEYREQIEYRFTELYYVITLFSYLSGVEKPKLSFVKELREGTERHFPEFDRNKYYQMCIRDRCTGCERTDLPGYYQDV